MKSNQTKPLLVGITGAPGVGKATFLTRIAPSEQERRAKPQKIHANYIFNSSQKPEDIMRVAAAFLPGRSKII